MDNPPINQKSKFGGPNKDIDRNSCLGCLGLLSIPFVAIISSMYIAYMDAQEQSRHNTKLELAREKAMDFCNEWKEAYPPYISKPGLFPYKLLDYKDEPIPGKVIYAPDLDKLPVRKPSADCSIQWSNKNVGEVTGRLIDAKYRSDDWPCHYGYRLNQNFNPANKSDNKYTHCMTTPFEQIVMKQSTYETLRTWRFDLEGKQLP